MKTFPSFLFPSLVGALLALAASPGAFGAPGCLTPPSGLVDWWPGDGNANDIQGTNNGTLQGGATATAAGLVAQAFSFDGTNGYVQIPNNAVLQPTNLTIEAWVRFASLDSAGSGGSPAGDQYIVFKQNSQTWNFEGFDLSKTRVAGGDVFRFLVTSATAQSVEIHSATMVATGVWYHVTAVRGSNFTQMYVNGQLERQTNVAFAQNYGSLPLYFGTSGESYWDHKLKGLLDEVSLYNRALSSNEVAAIYAAGAAGKCKTVNGLTITTQPQSQGVAVGSNAVFTVAASGAAQLSYQWQVGGAALAGATNTNLTLANVQPANGGNYTVVVTNSATSVTSAVAVLTVLVPAAITVQPQSLTNVTGTTATFSATVTGSAPLSYQWQLNGVSLANGGRISGATTNTLTITNVQPTDAGNYTLVVSNAAGVVASAVAALSVTGPPVITAQPASQSVVAGANASFGLTASGTPPLAYQWLFGNAALANANNASLTLTSVQPANAGNYLVVVANPVGSVTSAVAVLTVLVPPVITAQPQSLTNVTGTTASFGATASGSAPLGYQWQLNGASLANGGRISGAKTNTLSVTNVQPTDAGSYTLVVSNAAGVVTSPVATLTVISPPAITAQPVGQSVAAGTNASFSVTASGTPPLSYQWLVNGVNLAAGGQFSGTASPVLSIANAQITNVGGYSVVVTNVAGSVTSAVAGLTVIAPGSCLPAPANLVGWWPGDGNANDITGGNNGTLEGGATANAVGEVGQAFHFDGTNSYVSIPDSPVFHPTNLTVEYWVKFTSLDSQGSGGSPPGDQYVVFKQNSQTYNFEGFDLRKIRVAGSDIFKFAVTSATAQVAELHATNVVVATNVWYHVAGVRGSNFIQIYVNGQLEGQTNVSFPQNYGTLPLYFGTSGESYWDHKLNGVLDEVSLYNRALSSNEVAAIYAAGAAGKCKVVSAVNIAAQPQSQTVATGSNVLFTVTAGGTAPLSYQWQFNGAAMAGATSPNLTLANAQPTVAGNYAVMVTNSAASVASAVAVLTVLAPPAITTQPQSLTSAAGTTASFSATATGSAPLSYQWRLNGVNLANGGRISGATTTTLTISGVLAADAGNYALLVSNGAGLVTSAVAVLTVTGPPAIVTQPVSQSVVAGANATFSVTASGTAPLSYQWQFNGANVSGATSTSLTLAGVQSINAGSYTVVVANAAGSATSAAAVLTVAPAAGIVIINGAVTYQVIDGFGVNANSGSWTNNAMQPVIDALIDAGMTLFLAEFVGNCNWEAANANPSASLTNWTYFDNVYSGPNFQQLWGMMAYLNQRGITNGVMPKFTGPAALWMGGESLTPGYENAYAEMLASALIYARKTQNLQFTVVPPLNEPDNTYTGVHLSGASQYVTVVDDLGKQLDANGMSDVRFSGPELAYTTTSWMATMMGDSYLMSKLADFGLHSYQGLSSDATGVSSFIQQSAYPGTHFWMTEYNVWCASCQSGGAGDNSWSFALGTASYLLDLLAEGASAGLVFEAWDGEWINYNASTGQDTAPTWDFWGLFAVDDINATPKTYTPRQGFYTVSQITAFVRPGAQRINVGGASTPLTLLAFYNTNNGQFTLTGVNSTSSASSLSCALESLPAIPSLGFYYTSSTTNLCYGGSVAVNSGAFSVVVPASCVFTLTYTNTVAPLVISQTQTTTVAPHFLTPFGQKGNLSLTLVGASGAACLIEASSNLVDWFGVTNVTLLGGTATISQPTTTGARFYRATLLP